MQLRSLDQGDAAAFRAFVGRISPADRNFFKGDVSDVGAVGRLLADRAATATVAIEAVRSSATPGRTGCGDGPRT